MLGMVSFASQAIPIKIKITIKGKGGTVINPDKSVTTCPQESDKVCATIEVEVDVKLSDIFNQVAPIKEHEGVITYENGLQQKILIKNPNSINIQPGTNEAYIQGKYLTYTILE